VIKSRRMRWAGHVARIGAGEMYVWFWWGDLMERERPLGRPMLDGDNIKMYLQEVEWEDIDWIYLNQDRRRWRELVNAVMNLRVP